MSILKTDIRNLVYKLCEGREVPLLVTDIIAGLLVHRDLFTINTLSRTLNAQANAIIYRDVVVNLDGTDHAVTRASLLFRTLLTNDTAAQAVHSLSLAGDPLREWRHERLLSSGESIKEAMRGIILPATHADLTAFTKIEIELYRQIKSSSSTSMRSPSSKIPVWALYLNLLRFAPHVQHFSVSSDYFRSPGFPKTLRGIIRYSSTAKLWSCDLCLDLTHGRQRHISAVGEWDDAVLSAFAVPGIQSIAAVVSLKSHAVRWLRPGGSSVTRLELHHWQTGDVDLSSLLAATQSLKYLKYHITTDYGQLNPPWGGEATPGRREGLDFLYDALHSVSGSLEELHISHDVDEDIIHYSPGFGMGYEILFRRTAELSGLKRLHALTIPYMALLGCARYGYACDWDNVLPSSLRRIVLNDNLTEIYQLAEWTDETLMPVFSSLLEWLSATERGEQTAEFGLKLALLDEDFNEPERQELFRMCKERGVRCSIKKVHADRAKRPNIWIPRGRGGGGMGRGRGRGSGA